MVYFEIIRKKTASLIASCLASGTASTGASPEEIEKMRHIGEKIGIAFQIKDDILDFDTSCTKGKPSGIDIKERKMTLPLIYMLNNASYLQKRKIINIVKNHNTDREKVAWLMEQVTQSGGLDYAVNKMTQYRNEAIELLQQMPNKPAKESLRQLIDFTIERKI
jgi:octaprenyl-diphosphate synthase